MNSGNSSAGQAGRVLGAEVETGDREPVPGQAAADGAADAALPVHIGDVVEIKEKHEISQLDASAVELDAADLGAGQRHAGRSPLRRAAEALALASRKLW